MQRVINESVCDRCGKVFDTKPTWKHRGATRVGKIWELIPRLSDYLKNSNYEVEVRLYYVSHYSYLGLSDDKIVDLCDECKKELATWFNAPRLEKDE